MSKTAPVQPTPFERFREFTRRLVAVPKAEIDKQARSYQRKRKRQKRKKPVA